MVSMRGTEKKDQPVVKNEGVEDVLGRKPREVVPVLLCVQGVWQPTTQPEVHRSHMGTREIVRQPRLLLKVPCVVKAGETILEVRRRTSLRGRPVILESQEQ